MEKHQFLEFVKDLSAYFERKPPSPDTLRFWFEDIQKIPNECLQEVSGQIRRLEAWPKNLPNYIRGQFKDWLGRNPDRQHQEELGCLYCHQGFITVSSYDVSWGWGNALFACASCNPHSCLPKRTRRQLMEDGWFQPGDTVPKPYHKAFPAPYSLLPKDHHIRRQIAAKWALRKAVRPISGMTERELVVIHRAIEEDAGVPF